MNKNIEELRKKYNVFKYKKYEIIEDTDSIDLLFYFEIVGLTEFKHKISIKKKNYITNNINTPIAKNIVFNIGMVELISYWKSAFCPTIEIECGFLNDEQKNWFKKLYYYGLGELRYLNKIKLNKDEMVNIICNDKYKEFTNEDKIYDIKPEGFIIPVGGGKDSCVTLELLKNKGNNYCFIINPKTITLECAKIAGYSEDKIIEVNRILDKKIIELNNQGFINGHTPFSAMLSFVAYLVAYLTNKKYIALSNESSANESNVVGENINHQYSKSYEYEKDFEDYSDKYLNLPIKYFSFLRPLNELQIAKLFSKYEKYHSTFKSCNVGSKQEPWVWCCKCAKCLFPYIMFSPYLYKNKLIQIFGKDLYEDKELLDIFIMLTGNGENKPFECVGTYEEVNYAISITIKKLEENNNILPFLLKYYKEHFKFADITIDITKRFNRENSLPKEFEEILEKEIL